MKSVIEETITLSANIGNLSEFREFVKKRGTQAGIAEDILFDLTLVVDEACTNIIQHSYKDHEPGKITITFTIHSDRAMITIADHGRAFETDNTIEPDINAHWQDRKIGGLGWHLIKGLTDETTYRSDPINGNQLFLVKMLNQKE